MTEADIKNAIKTIEIHHENGWWVAELPDIGVATQAKTLPELGVEIERIVIAHFEVSAEYGTDPLRGKRPSTVERYDTVLTTALEGWDRAARALADDPHHPDVAQIRELLMVARDEPTINPRIKER